MVKSTNRLIATFAPTGRYFRVCLKELLHQTYSNTTAVQLNIKQTLFWDNCQVFLKLSKFL